MDDTTTNPRAGGRGEEAARQTFREEDLPWPPVPEHLCASLRHVGSFVFATQTLACSPYDLRRSVAAFEAEGDLPDRATVGFDGHGVNSWAVHCYIVCDGLGLFIQLPWGGAFVEREPARDEIIEMFDWATRIQHQWAAARKDQRVPRGRRLEIVASRLSHAGWRWLDEGADPAAVPWQPAAGMKATLLAELDGLRAPPA